MTFMESERTRVELEKVIRELDLDAILITDRYNMRYIASYRGEGVIFYTKDAKYVLTDSRYTEQVERECDGYECIDIAGLGYAGNLNQLITTIKCSPEYTGSKVRVGFENLSISYSDYDIYQNKLDEVELVAIDGRLDSIREIKTDDEIEKLHVAERILLIRPGVKWRKVRMILSAGEDDFPDTCRKILLCGSLLRQIADLARMKTVAGCDCAGRRIF